MGKMTRAFLHRRYLRTFLFARYEFEPDRCDVACAIGTRWLMLVISTLIMTMMVMIMDHCVSCVNNNNINNNNRDRGASRWHGTSQSRTGMLTPTSATQPWRQELQPSFPPPTRPTNTANCLHPHLPPVAIETAGTWHHLAFELVQELGRRATITTGDSRETTYSFQQLSVALQKGAWSRFRTCLQPTSLLQPVIFFF